MLNLILIKMKIVNKLVENIFSGLIRDKFVPQILYHYSIDMIIDLTLLR